MLLTSVNNSNNGETGDLESYPYCPDSPIDHLVYPSSGYSGHMRNDSSVLDSHITAAVPVTDFSARLQHTDLAMDRRASVGLTVEDVARCLEKKIANPGDSVSASFRLAPTTSSGNNKRESNDTRVGLYIDETYHDLPEKARRSLSLRLNKEFNFNIDDCTTVDPSVGSNWWANDKVTGITAEPEKK